MDIQKLVDAMNDSNRSVRSDYHLTLGKLIKVLENTIPELPVFFSCSTDSSGLTNVGHEDSYRGYYSDLAFDVGDKEKTVAELLKQCKKAVNATYTGYKGGNFVMDEDTPLWRAEYGSHWGEAIIGYQIFDDKFILICKPEED